MSTRPRMLPVAELSRRRFLTISAAAGSLCAVGSATHAEPIAHWVGNALGARTSIWLRHPESSRVVSAVRGEIERLEQIFSLYRTSSSIVRLNAAGQLDAPPFELVELLGLCSTVHKATRGLFDPSVQPLWATYAEHHVRGEAPGKTVISAALERVGWGSVLFSAERVAFRKPAMSLTFNGIAQGYIADKVASLLRSEGLNDILVDTGELVAVGGHPDGGGWPVTLAGDRSEVTGRLISLREAGLASSSPLGTALDSAGTVSHILDPLSGLPAKARWKLLTVKAPTAALADALSTSMCLMTRKEITAVLGQFPQVELVHLV